MELVLLNLQSNQEINLDKDNPFVIGRGFDTGCTDKRVSRSHCRITCRKDGKVSLLALHSNPCFFTRKGTPPVLQLNKNEEEVLNEGDCLGLLPNLYWYQITSKSRLKNRKSSNSNLKLPQRNVPKTETIPKEEMMDLIEKSKDSATLKRSASDDNKDNTPPKNVCHEVPVPSCSGESTNIVIPDHLKGTCKLPLWRYEIKGQKNFAKKYADSTTIKISDNVKAKHTPDAQSTLWDTPADLASSSTAASADKTKEKSPDVKKSCEDDFNDEAIASKSKFGRPYCQYDANCYRKNAQHKLEYSHPGDEDYVEYENRPLCMYGADCYRRNLLHRRQFRHVGTQDPRDPQTSQAPEAPVDTADLAEAPDVPGASVDSTPAPVPDAPVDPAASTAASTLDASSKSSSKVKEIKIKREPKERSKTRPKNHHKRKRHSENDRSQRSCRLSVTVSSRPKQKRRRNSQAGAANFASFYSSDVSFDGNYSSSEPYSDDYSSDDYLPSTDSDDFDAFEYYGKDYFRDYYF